MGQQFTITLADDLASLVRRQVEDGTYASIDDAVDMALRDALSPVAEGSSLDGWVRREGLARLRAFEADPKAAMSLDEVDEMIEREFAGTRRRT